jgi:hypothetical protein
MLPSLETSSAGMVFMCLPSFYLYCVEQSLRGICCFVRAKALFRIFFIKSIKVPLVTAFVIFLNHNIQVTTGGTSLVRSVLHPF